MSSSLSMTAPPDADEDFDENTKSSGGNKKSIRKRLGLSKTSKSSKGKKSSNKHNSNEKRASSEISIDVGGSNNSTTDNDVVVNDDEGGSSSSVSALSASASASSIATGGGSGSGKQRSSRGERRGSTGARAIGEGVMRRVRSLSRSRGSRHRSSGGSGDGNDTDNSSDNSSSSSEGGGSGRRKSTVVTVTSCRSDGYYNQKAPGSTSKLPRKAPTNLKLFHELAVGLKDAFTAVGQTPMKPIMEQEIEDEITGEKKTIVMDENEFIGRTVLWDFMGNIDFVRKYKMNGFDLISFILYGENTSGRDPILLMVVASFIGRFPFI
jgi:hypothetical protein